jgi:hypothetical protein
MSCQKISVWQSCPSSLRNEIYPATWVWHHQFSFSDHPIHGLEGLDFLCPEQSQTQSALPVLVDLCLTRSHLDPLLSCHVDSLCVTVPNQKELCYYQNVCSYICMFVCVTSLSCYLPTSSVKLSGPFSAFLIALLTTNREREREKRSQKLAFVRYACFFSIFSFWVFFYF